MSSTRDCWASAWGEAETEVLLLEIIAKMMLHWFLMMLLAGYSFFGLYVYKSLIMG
jgi:hypothetical protein